MIRLITSAPARGRGFFPSFIQLKRINVTYCHVHTFTDNVCQYVYAIRTGERSRIPIRSIDSFAPWQSRFFPNTTRLYTIRFSFLTDEQARVPARTRPCTSVPTVITRVNNNMCRCERSGFRVKRASRGSAVPVRPASRAPMPRPGSRSPATCCARWRCAHDRGRSSGRVPLRSRPDVRDGNSDGKRRETAKHVALA